MPRFVEGYADRIAVPPGSRDVLKFDTEVRGFGIRKFADERSIYFIKYQVDGKWRRVTLGEVVAGNLRKMRLLASSIKAESLIGRDVLAERQAAIDAQKSRKPLLDVIPVYLAARKKDMRPSSFDGVNRYLRKHWKPLHQRDIRSITKDEVEQLLDDIKENNGGRAADCARIILSVLFDWAIANRDPATRQRYAEANPLLGIKPKAKMVRRERVLTEPELVEVWQAAGEDHFGRIIKLLILLGQRKTEIGDLSDIELNEMDRQIELASHRTKNGKPHKVPLSDLALSLIPPKRRGCAYRFGRRNGFSGWSKGKKELDARIAASRKATGKPPMPAWTLHDLRRTFTTIMNERGIAPPHIIEAILNHISGHQAGVAGTYNRAKYLAERIKALNEWTAFIIRLVSKSDIIKKAA